jgi:hypothetical protein
MSYTGFWDELRKIPPVTRFLCASSLAVSVPVMMQLLSPYKVVFVRELVIHRFEVRGICIATIYVLMMRSCGGSGQASFSEVSSFLISHFLRTLTLCYRLRFKLSL